jgi:hypothetical protein
MQDKITVMKEFLGVETKGNVTRLLKEVKVIMLQIDTNTSAYDALDEAINAYYKYKQEDRETNAKHLRNFKSIVAAVEHLGGSMFPYEELIEMEREKDIEKGLTGKSDVDYKKVVRDKMLGVAFIKRANDKVYTKLITSICDQHSFTKDVYPKSLHEAYELLENHSSANKGTHVATNQSGRGGEVIEGEHAVEETEVDAQVEGEAGEEGGRT